jgi:hypothetical protein
LGYEFISGVNIWFGHIYTTREDATVTVGMERVVRSTLPVL